ncbi:MAG: glycerol-3-phosphate dehydrogenase [Deltaproteobacteria bacterium]|nr:glycerol-3-phosphate dehydrogenase [Deltaproteobacteria bacterium]
MLITRRAEREGRLIRTTPELSAVADRPLVVLAVPSSVIVELARSLGDHLDGAHVVVHGIRGLAHVDAVEGTSATPALRTIADVLRVETPARRLGALGGPVQADELHHGTASALVVGSRFPEVVTAVREAMSGPWLRVFGTSDLRGVELSSAMVGCLGVGVGFAKAAGAGPGLLAALISRGVHDAGRLLAAAGGEEPTIYGLAGYGDQLASIAQDARPEVVVGRALAEGKSIEAATLEARLRVEAIGLVPQLVSFARASGLSVPTFDAIGRVLDGECGEALLGAFFANA